METAVITPQLLEKAMSYEQYLNLIDTLLKEEKTTGANHSPNMIHYARLNQQRMKKWDKTGKLQPELVQALQNLPTAQHWLVLTEGWCGDAAQNIPFLAKMAAVNPEKISLKLILRDENLEVMDAYLTNGGRSIPKLVSLKQADFDELGTWGPRPAKVQQMVLGYKQNPTVPQDAFVESVHAWYAKDKGQELQQEFITLLQQWQ